MTPERKSVHFSFGGHTASAIEPLERLKQRAINTIEDSSGAVVYVRESANATKETSELLYKISEKGLPPSICVAVSNHIVKNSTIPKIDDSLMDSHDEYLESTHSWDRKELLMLNDVHFTYPGRLRVLYEGAFEASTETATDAFAAFDDAEGLTKRGEFDLALPLFKRAISALTTNNKYREEAISKQIDKVIQDDTVEAVIVRLGSAHSPIRYGLGKAYKVTSEFDTNYEGKHEFSTFETLTRAARLNQKLSLSKTEWYQAMLASVTEVTLLGMMGEDQTLDKKSVILEITRQFIYDAPTMHEVREIESIFKHQGFPGFLTIISAYLPKSFAPQE